MKKFRVKLFLAASLGAAAFIGGSGLTISSGWLITMASQHPPILTLSVAIVMVRFFGISRSIARYLERIISHESVFRRLTSLRVLLFGKFTKIPMRLAKDMNSGSLVKSIVDDVERAQEYQLRVTLPGITAGISLLIGILVGISFRPQTVFITIPASLLLLIVIPYLIKKTCSEQTRKLELLEGQYSELITSTSHGIVEAKMYGYFDQGLQNTHAVEFKLLSQERNLFLRTWGLGIISSAVIGFAIISATILSYRLANLHQLPVVQITMIIFLPLVIFEAITAWHPNLYASGKLLLAQEKINTFLDEEFSSSYEPDITPGSPEVIVENATAFWGSEFMKPVSFTLSKGEKIVIRGRSGSGKSTFAMALLGLLPFKGAIKVTGKISGTLQEGHIFNTSLRENLLLANPGLSDYELVDVLELLELQNISLDEMLGEYGRPLSGGEGKRIGLARALLGGADVLVLDEPTEHLDHDLASRIERRVLEKYRGTTIIIITHSGWGNVGRNITIERE